MTRPTEKHTNDLGSTGDESEDGESSITHNDQDSDVSCENDTDGEIDTTVIEEEEDWIDHNEEEHKRCQRKDGKCEDSMLGQDSQKMKWRLALRIASVPYERWMVKAAGWNPELSSKYRTNRAIGRPRKRWEDDINECLKT